MRNKKLCERWFLSNDADDGLPFYPRDGGVTNRFCSRRAYRLTREAALAKEVAAPQDRNHRLLSALRDDRQLGIAILDVKEGVGFFALFKNDLPAPVFLSG